eukprot:4940705-Alexandrium_andersonii.AAC.1
MSASLVGSEMCIRDSPSRPTGRSALVPSPASAESRRSHSVAAPGAGGAARQRPQARRAETPA